MPKYVSMAVEPEARASLTRLALTAAATVGQRVTLSAVIRAAVTVAERHPDELTAAITNQTGADQ